MGRIRKTLHWMVPVVGGTGASPIRAESSAERAAREHADLIREQNRLLAKQNGLLANAGGQEPEDRPMSEYTDEELDAIIAERKRQRERRA
jgi:hypothetical protein